MLTQFNILLERLTQADFLILVMEPLFYLGVFLGLVGFAVGYFLSDSRARNTGLVIVAVSCFSVYPYLKLASKATPRITAVSGSWSPAAVKAQFQRRHDTRWFFYGMGCFAVMGIAASGSTAKIIGITTLAAGSGIALFGLWLHLMECEIYHPYIKQVSHTREKAATHAAAPPPRAPH